MFNPGNPTPAPQPESTLKPKNRLKPLLVTLTVLFLLVDVGLAYYYFYQRQRKEDEMQRMLTERAEKARTDSIAAVERARERRDSIRQAETVKSRFVNFTSFFTPVTANMHNLSEYTDEVTVSRVDALYPTADIGTMLRSKGYELVASRYVTVEYEGETIQEVEEVYAINCRWDRDAQAPMDLCEPWNCVVVTPGECFPTIRIFFDSSDSRQTFINGMQSRAVKRVSDTEYSAIRAYKGDDGYNADNEFCSNEFTIRRDINNSLVIK